MTFTVAYIVHIPTLDTTLHVHNMVSQRRQTTLTVAIKTSSEL